MRTKFVKLFNLIHAYLDILLARDKPRAYPVELSVGTTSYCNLKCIQCPREGHDGNRIPYDDHLDMEYYRGLEPLLQRAKDVTLYGLGEPMIDKQYFDKVRYVTSFGAAVSLSTNGTLMDERRCREMIESGIKVVGISLDAAREETFAQVRPPGGLSRIVDHIKMLTRLKKEMNSPFPVLRLSFGIMPQNIGELREFPDLAAEVGGEELVVHPVIYMSRSKMEELYLSPDALREPVEKARRRAEELGLKLYFWNLDAMTFLKSLEYVQRQERESADLHPRAREHRQRPHYCLFLWRNAMIQGHGELFPCCYITNVHLGQLDRNDLLAWRDHPFLTAMRRQLFDGDIPEPCVHCPQLFPFDRARLLKSGLIEIWNLIKQG